MTIHVIEDFEFFKEHALTCTCRFYQEIKHDNKVLIKARAGFLGFEKELDLTDPEQKREYEEIIETFKRYRFVELKKVVADNEFFIV